MMTVILLCIAFGRMANNSDGKGLGFALACVASLIVEGWLICPNGS